MVTFFYYYLLIFVFIVLGALLCIQAILYSSPTDEEEKEDEQCKDQTLPSGLEVWSPVLPPCLVGPSVQYSSVLITDVKSSNAITIR